MVNVERTIRTMVESNSSVGPQYEDVQSSLVVDAHLHSLESFINPDVNKALSLQQRHADMLKTESNSPLFAVAAADDSDQVHAVDEMLGVALLQPVTTGIEFGKTSRSRFPSRRFLCVNVDPISTMLSFDDLQLIESVLNRLTSERNVSASTETDAGGIKVEPEKQETGGVDLGRSRTIDTPEAVHSSYEVVFHSDQLGLGLRKQGNNIVVDEVRDGVSKEIQVGDILVSIEGRKVVTLSLSDVVRQLASVPRPATVTFLSSASNSGSQLETGSATPAVTAGKVGVGIKKQRGAGKPRAIQTISTSYTLHFHRGMPNGLSLEKSWIADMPVVTRVDPCIASALVSNANSLPLPKPGAMVTQVNGIDSAELGFDETLGAIAKQRDSCESMQTESAGDQPSYEITFVERSSNSWGTHDSFDLSLQGAILTFIDDLNGRDMPLLRGTLETVEMHLKRGMGINTHVLARMKRFPCLLHGSSIRSWETDCSVSLSAVAKTTIEYFHPRKAVYEPFLEPAQLCILYECHNTSSTEVQDQVAIEVADRLLQNVASFHQTPRDSEPQLLCVNFSDASAEVLARAINEWKNWRTSVKKSTDLSLFPEQLAGQSITPDSPQFPSLPHSLVSNQNPQSLASTGGVGEIYIDGNTAKPAAASNAAHAAFLFAQKRGAEKSGKSESSKPFVFRNRTGISIAFVQQERTEKPQSLGRMKRSQSKNTLVGEYRGLDHCLREDVTELADGEDAKFQMEALQSRSAGGQGTTKRVRTYEGHFPRLAVAIQAVAGVLVDPLLDLQVQKAGTSIRHLSVHKSEATDTGNNDNARYSIAVVWKVEVEDNRRICTLSSAVRIVSLNSTVGIEIGARKGGTAYSSAMPGPSPCEVDVILREEMTDAASGYSLEIAYGNDVHLKDTILDNSIEHECESFPNVGGSSMESVVQTIGVSLPESPIYLPLWLVMRLEPVEIYVRPKLKGLSQYTWGAQSVLVFAPSDLAGAGSESKWGWQETFTEALGSIRCNSINQGTPAAFLSCYTSNQERIQDDVNLESSLHQKQESVDEAISVFIDSGLSIRNLLPVEVEWQAAHGLALGSPELVDGSSLRDGEDSIQRTTLKTGECAEVYTSNFKVESLATRFRFKHGECWSEWALVSSPNEEETETEGDLSTPTKGGTTLGVPSLFQTNVQIDDEFGAPITLGVRVVPKVAKDHRSHFKAICFGIDVIVYAELWISNLTSLPLTFGCPALQVHKENSNCQRNSKAQTTEEAAIQFSAEAALMEIASVLELGEKGSKIDTRNAALQQQAGEVVVLPHQETPLLVEEVFEFIEIEGSNVKRRWWASENYWNLRDNSILELSDNGKTWHWVDETWKIDCAGHASAVSGGWESCKDLLGSGEGPFSLNRQFDPAHPFRRRRWFRTRSTSCRETPLPPTTKPQCGRLLPGLQVFHHPLHDVSSKAQERVKQRKKKQRERENFEEDGPRRIEADQADAFNISIKCGDGRWCAPARISSRGNHHGAVEVYASRWPSLPGTVDKHTAAQTAFRASSSVETSDSLRPYSYGSAPLNPTLHDLVYHVKEVDGDCGEFSRLMLVAARYSVRNDSERKTIEVKQSGTKDEHSIRLYPGEIAPFYWSDFCLPQLVCVRPVDTSGSSKVYKWSGGFDVCTLGMTALSIRPMSGHHTAKFTTEQVRSMRTLVELRPGTGGLGINISFKEERQDGDGALFRIENRSSFNIWLSQEGVLGNPSLSSPHPEELDGDLISPGDQVSFGLDIPYRQGKYAGRQAATMSELLRVRVALAPLSTRAGIETLKVLGLSVIGESVRLKPSKLTSILGTEQVKGLERVRVLAIITADGPSRVLKFWYVFLPSFSHTSSPATFLSLVHLLLYSLMAKPEVENVMGSVFMDSVSYGGSPTNGREDNVQGAHLQAIVKGASMTQEMLVADELLTEGEAKREALFGETKLGEEQPLALAAAEQDRQILFRVSFSGFLVSLVDSSPSEICTVAVNTVNVLAKWSQLRTSDASFLMSIGWLQVDNHVPSAPFPVAISPEGNEFQDKNKGFDKGFASSERSTPGAPSETGASPPLLFVGIEFAPKHSSGIVVSMVKVTTIGNILLSWFSPPLVFFLSLLIF